MTEPFDVMRDDNVDMHCDDNWRDKPLFHISTIIFELTKH